MCKVIKMYSQELLPFDLKEALWTVGGLWPKVNSFFFFFLSWEPFCQRKLLQHPWWPFTSPTSLHKSAPPLKEKVYLSNFTYMQLYASVSGFCVPQFDLKTYHLPTLHQQPRVGDSMSEWGWITSWQTCQKDKIDVIWYTTEVKNKNKNMWRGWKCMSREQVCILSVCFVSLSATSPTWKVWRISFPKFQPAWDGNIHIGIPWFLQRK